ncbi:ATP-dependent DNA helicase [Candidatus Magnetomorum sp. HK-1]|nr:ATP-dependent DNA helicase [Candidatus Magnetomorum sp. HK-1]
MRERIEDLIKKPEGPVKGVYIRLGSTNRRADGSLIEELKRTTTGFAFDELPLPDLSINDLDLQAIRKKFDKAKKLTNNELLTLKLIKRVQGRMAPTIGGLLPGLTISDIRSGISRLRNKVIGRVFRELKLIMKKLKLNHRPSFLYVYFQPALKKGLIELTQPNSPRSPTQKYRLTKKGKALL